MNNIGIWVLDFHICRFWPKMTWCSSYRWEMDFWNVLLGVLHFHLWIALKRQENHRWDPGINILRGPGWKLPFQGGVPFSKEDNTSRTAWWHMHLSILQDGMIALSWIDHGCLKMLDCNGCPMGYLSFQIQISGSFRVRQATPAGTTCRFQREQKNDVQLLARNGGFLK